MQVQYKVGLVLLPHQYHVAAEVQRRVLVGGCLLVVIRTLFYKARKLVRCDGFELAGRSLVAFRAQAAIEALHEHPHLRMVELGLALFAAAGGATTRSSCHG